MTKFLRSTFTVVAGLALLFASTEGKAATWQETLDSKFDIVDTFDELQDWTPGGQWYSGAGCATCPSNSSLPKKIDGSKSIWQLWNTKGLSFQFTPGSGTFAIGDVVTGGTSGATATVRRVWNLDGKSYIQITYDNTARGTSKFVAGERISSGSKTGTNLQWPLMIGNHGAAYTWRGTGKSLVLDIGDNDNLKATDPTMAGLGVQRLGTYFGDGTNGKSGYKKVYVFFMMKVSPTFFNKCLDPGTTCVAGGYDATKVIKAFDLCSGFTGVSEWGTAADRALVDASWAYRVPEYGMNYSLFNFIGGGLSNPQNLFYGEHNRVATGTAPNYTVANIVNNRPLRSGTTLDINSYISTGDWYGVELAADIGTKGNNDGSTDFWIYDKNGVEKGHFSVTGQNHLMYFDHFYNKITLGGNRLSGHGLTGGLDSRWWIDDFIINGSRIGTTYFQLLSAQGNADGTAPTASISAPAGGSTVTGTTTVSIGASDNVGVSKVELYVNGVLQGSDTAAPYAVSWNTANVANSTYTLTAKAYDAAGNIGQSAPVSVTVKNVVGDTTAPTASISAPTANATVSGTTPVSMTASDNVAVSKVELYVNGALYGMDGTAPYSMSWNSASYPDGAYTLTAKAYDAAGNVGTSSAVSVNVKNTVTATKYSLTASAGTGGTITPAGTTSVTSGASQTYTITPATGYKISAVKVDGALVGTASSYTFSNVTANHTIAASFTSTTATTVFAVNCGGSQYTSTGSVSYSTDTRYTGGAASTTTSTITGTTDQTLYKSERWGTSFGYNIPLPNGTYSVTLRFAEFAYSTVGSRVFNVAIGGSTVISNLDIYSKVGKNAAYDVTLPVTVTNGTMNIQLSGKVGNAKINAIQVRRV
ncbi:Ig-like domain-containing protein [Geomonas sp. RF6]|uniref:Ig-like domain-containing protein n=1 Tax=Geomonas sp. RF6 TaxID=2897342 RepID=UPI001E2FD2FC|nr:Ig-like domain-containing protein [Geomonas sp. RF6]UFS69144.1 Ig-like domain-containing protein [Geomonas sp. RF6]